MVTFFHFSFLDSLRERVSIYFVLFLFNSDYIVYLLSLALLVILEIFRHLPMTIMRTILRLMCMAYFLGVSFHLSGKGVHNPVVHPIKYPNYRTDDLSKTGSEFVKSHYFFNQRKLHRWVYIHSWKLDPTNEFEEKKK